MSLTQILVGLFNISTLLYTFFGVVLGIIVGAIPGLSGPIGVALLLPFTYNMGIADSLLLLGGIYMGATYGGSISAILINCPGTGEAACTAIDGSALAKQGRAKEALYYSIFSSGIGGICGVFAMIFCTPALVEISLQFGPAEMFLLAFAGLAVIGSLLGSSPAKGFIAVAIGLLLSIVGMDTLSVGTTRLTFGIPELMGGIPLIPVSVGLFAMTEMLTLASSNKKVIVEKLNSTKVSIALRNIAKRWWLVVKSTIIGIIVGILPGTGGAIAAFVSYGEAGRATKDKATFGKGNIDGIIAPETANNAAVGGSFVPLLSLGIPGSATSAIIYGALTMKGIQPGPSLFEDPSGFVYVFMWGMLIATIMMIVLGAVGAPAFAKILKIKTNYLVSAILIFAIIGVYSSRNSLFDVALSIFFGFIGIFFKKVKIPIAPVLLGLILGKTLEENLRRSMIIASAKEMSTFMYIFKRPISLIIFFFATFIIVANTISMVKARRSIAKASEVENG